MSRSILIATRNCPAPAFATLTYPRFRPLLTATDGDTMQPDCLAVGATSHDIPVGLALLSSAYGEDERRLLSIFVTPLFRRQGIGLKLLAAVEQTSRENGTRKLVAFHTDRAPGYRKYENLVRKAGWSSPEPFEYRLGGRANWIDNAERDWHRFLARVRRSGFNAKDWTELTDEDLEQIAWLVANEMPESDKMYDPIEYTPANLVPELCILLRCGTEIAGWILGQKGANEDSYHYTHGYALPKYQRRGYLIVGMMEVCRRQSVLFGSETMSTYETRNVQMRRLMHQRIKPYSEWTDERFVCEKRL